MPSGEDQGVDVDRWILAQSLRAVREHAVGLVAVVEQRLDSMGEATKVLHETITRVPTELEREITHLKELIGARLTTVETQIRERDERQNKEHTDNETRVQTAVAAQREALAAVEQRIDHDRAAVEKEITRLQVAQANIQARLATWFVAIGLFVSMIAVGLRFL